MTIFEVRKDALLRLSAEQLEELIARLAEAEVAKTGASIDAVSWGGSINATDGGNDVQVNLPDACNYEFGVIPRRNTVFQAKKHAMSAAKIIEEMRPKGEILPMIIDQAQASGAYVIVSLKDDCSPKMMTARTAAMSCAVETDPNSASLHLNFYDRSRLHQWLRQHPTVQLWVRQQLGIPLSGWQPYGAWSKTPSGINDTLITAAGVFVTMSNTEHKIPLGEAIEPIRDLIRSTRKSIRITGLSGVGKTRIVQALFEDNVGDHPLDRTLASYADIGDEPDPSATAMLDHLAARDQQAIVILDNCPSGLHANLASRVAQLGDKIQLITVEYDIRDDKPSTTDVIQIVAEGPDIAEALILRRFPKLGQLKARRIAEFGEGNARVSLAVAERVEEGDTISHLTDTTLFNRLFDQRNDPDSGLRTQAEALSLVYSYSVNPQEDGVSELEILGALCEATHKQMYRSSAELVSRQIAQHRGRWRAVLPHAIANRLAASALNNIPTADILKAFEKPQNRRLLKSLAHRLGMMHDHPIAIEIAHQWLGDGGLLANITSLDRDYAEMLEYIAPVAPKAVLNQIDAVIGQPNFKGFAPATLSRKITIINLLVALAYDPDLFDRAIQLLIRVSDFEDEANNSATTFGKIAQFFAPYYSGTHATADQRAAIVRQLLQSNDTKRQKLGFKALAACLGEPNGGGPVISDFGVRPRDYGFCPDADQLLAWRTGFIDMAIEYGNSDDKTLRGVSRIVLARVLRRLWRDTQLQPKLMEAAITIHNDEPWIEGWKSVMITIDYNFRRSEKEQSDEPIPDILAQLRALLAPKSLLDKIRTYVLGDIFDNLSLVEEFGDDDEDKYQKSSDRAFAICHELGRLYTSEHHPISQLFPYIFTAEYASFGVAFGNGLASGSSNLMDTWRDLIDGIDNIDINGFNPMILTRFLQQASKTNDVLVQDILDQCVADLFLQKSIVRLLSFHTFDERDLERCLQVLACADVKAWSFNSIIWNDDANNLPHAKLVELAELMLKKEHGDSAILQALSLRIGGAKSHSNSFGPEFAKIGLNAAKTVILKGEGDAGGMADHYLKTVVSAALSIHGNDDEKLTFLDAIFSIVDQKYGYMHSYRDAMCKAAQVMLEDFLDRVFCDGNDLREKRINFLHHGTTGRPPLTDVDGDRLIKWCATKGQADIWEAVAGGISPFTPKEKDKPVMISDIAQQFLEASPNPDQVLTRYASQISPYSGWSSKRVEIMERKLEAFRPLQYHPDRRISDAVGGIISSGEEMVGHERERQRLRDEERERRFE